MGKIILVDDEFLSRNALRTLLDWSAYGLTITAEANDGREAVLAIQTQMPDVAFIDISMPGMNGLELLGWIRQHAPQVVCVMLSSYSDFDYVLSAMKQGAVDYLLKHQLTPQRVLQVLERAGITMAHPQQVPDPAEVTMERFLAEGIGAPPPGYANGIVCFSAFARDRGRKGTRLGPILSTCQHIAAQGELVLMPDAETLVFVLAPLMGETPGEQMERAKALQQTLGDAIRRYHNTALTFTLPLYGQDARQLREQYLLYRSARSEAAPNVSQAMSLELDSGLMFALLGNQAGMIAGLLEEHFAHSGVPQEQLEQSLTHLLTTCSERLLGTAGVAQGTLRMRGPKAYFVEAFTALCHQYHASQFGEYAELVRKALHFLGAHYTEDVRLSDAAAYCCVNSSYLSYLFKKETGIGMNQYVNAMRIALSMRLMLLRSAPPNAVYEQVGFNSYGHFFTVFKSITGISPTEFKREPSAAQYMLRFSPLKPEMLTR